MRCTIENKNLPGLRSICKQPRIDDDRSIVDSKHYVRIEVTAKGVSIESPFGGMDAESRANEPGVVFVPSDWFLEAMSDIDTNYYIEIEASDKKVVINKSMIVPQLESFAFFDDPETAPRECPLMCND